MRHTSIWPTPHGPEGRHVFLADRFPDQRKYLLTQVAVDEAKKPFIMPKQVPPKRVGIIRTAFNDTVKDPKFLVDMSKEKLPVHPVTGEDAEKIVNELISAPSKIVAQAKAI